MHRVRITRSFYLGQYKVTVGQFKKFLSTSGYLPESVADGTGGYGYNPAYDPKTSKRGDAFEGRNPVYSWQNPGFAQGDDHPVVNVTWNDAVALSRWLSEKEGKNYCLPTEAEWEYACRAGTRTRYYSGDDPQSLLKVANTFDADTTRNWPQWQSYALTGHDGFEFTAPVGSFAPNAWGLYDMHGNAWEWVSDWYGESYYATRRWMIPRDLPRDRCACVGVDHGTRGRFIAGLRSATGIHRRRATRWWAYGCCAKSLWTGVERLSVAPT